MVTTFRILERKQYGEKEVYRIEYFDDGHRDTAYFTQEALDLLRRLNLVELESKVK